MQIFRELILSGSSDNLSDLISSIDHALRDGWKRNHEPEQPVSEGGGLSRFCFESPAMNNRSGSWLFLAFNGSHNELRISNVIPGEMGKLEMSEYNAIVVEFFTRFVEPQLTVYGERIKCVLGSENVGLQHWMSETTATRLKQFCDLANRSMLHHYDTQRWLQFLIAIHNEGVKFSELRRWLIEEEHWTEDNAIILQGEFDFAMQLLTVYDGTVS